MALSAASPARRIVSRSSEETASAVNACVVPVFIITSTAESAKAVEAASIMTAIMITITRFIVFNLPLFESCLY